jgi:hypothetical protein
VSFVMSPIKTDESRKPATSYEVGDRSNEVKQRNMLPMLSYIL